MQMFRAFIMLSSLQHRIQDLTCGTLMYGYKTGETRLHGADLLATHGRQYLYTLMPIFLPSPTLLHPPSTLSLGPPASRSHRSSS